MSTNAPTWDDVATLARAASALLDSRDLSHDLSQPITQEQIDDLVGRARALGAEVDVDTEIDAAWAAHGGSVATAVGIRGEFEGETATVLIAVLVRDNETTRIP